MSSEPACSLSRDFPASPQQVFDAWTDPSRLALWWGPRESTAEVCDFQSKPGGGIRIDLRGRDGAIERMIGAMEEIEAPGMLVFTSAVLDDTGRALFKVRTAVSIGGVNGHSTLELRVWVIQKSGAAAEIILAGMKPAWAQSLDRLSACLADVPDDAGQDPAAEKENPEPAGKHLAVPGIPAL